MENTVRAVLIERAAFFMYINVSALIIRRNLEMEKRAMKKRKALPIIIAAAILAVLAGVGYKLYDLMFNGAVKVQKVDVINGIIQCRAQLITGGVILLIGVICLIVSRLNKSSNKRYLISVQGCVALILALVVTITSVCLGPMYDNVNTLLAGNDRITDEHRKASLETAEKIAEEGITLLKNDDHALPLEKSSKLNVFGWSSIKPIYGGSGSGSTSEENAISLIDGLEEAGFETNKEIQDFYTDFRNERPEIGFSAVDFTIPEPSFEEYVNAGIFDHAKEFSDTAVVVIGRASGEGIDMAMSLSEENNFVNDEQGNPIVFSTQEDDLDASRSFLELTHRESAMVEEVADSFENVIVVVNSAQAMELGWVDDYENINAVIWCPSPGEVGFKALGRIINGEVNPSGHLVDTFVYDLQKTPYINNFGSFDYENYEDVTGAEENKAVFVNYNEGIYVGYKFYETAAAEGLIDYDTTVQYPFGYGMSYTEFEAAIDDVQDDGNSITMDIKVDNIGDVAGKFTAEIFYNPPYKNGGIEKATANLVEFAKTGIIEAGESEIVTVQFDYEDMASYDSECLVSKNGAYVLESGDYQINLCSDSHTVLDTYTATVSSDIIYDEEHEGSRSTDNVAATNQFEYAKSDVTYLSRANKFENYEEAIAGPDNFEMTDEIKADYASRITFDASAYDDPDAEMPTTGADNGLKIQDMQGVDYDDPSWDKLLDQLTVDELKNMIANGTFHTVETKSINLPYVFETDGPTAVNSFFTGKRGTAFTAPLLVAATWNKELAAEFGDRIGQELVDYGFTGWYGSGMNIHRTAFSGRNFEYYSEDAFLSGKIAAYEIAAVREHGIITYLKHFVMNDSETDRAKGICTWSTEQAIREIYLKPFEMAVKEGNSNGIMNSKNAIGSKWVGSNPEVQINVLRKEWGFMGAVMTDSLDTVSGYYQNPNEAVRAGTDKMLAFTVDEGYWDNESTGTIIALRNAAHNVLYTLANSNAMEISTGTPSWVFLLAGCDIVILLLLVVWEVAAIKKVKRSNHPVIETVEK